MKAVAEMLCLFLEEQVDIEAKMLCWKRVIRLLLDVLEFSDEYLFKCFCFSVQSIIYLNNFLRSHIGCMTQCGHALSLEQILCVAHFVQ